jgi:hypothetical protein
VDAFEIGIRCAWCSKVQQGEEWVDTIRLSARRRATPPLWSDGICPSCFEALAAPGSGYGARFAGSTHRASDEGGRGEAA